MKSLIKSVSWILVIMAVVSLIGCASSKKAGDKKDGVGTEKTDGTQFDLYADSDSGKAGDLKTVHFPYDSDVINSEGEEVLKGDVSFLQKLPKVKVQIEGHCDERGSIQYNLALGMRRAKAVQNYLVASGIPADRISITSLGKEKPISMGHNEESWSKNRRANFVIIEK